MNHIHHLSNDLYQNGLVTPPPNPGLIEKKIQHVHDGNYNMLYQRLLIVFFFSHELTNRPIKNELFTQNSINIIIHFSYWSIFKISSNSISILIG